MAARKRESVEPVASSESQMTFNRFMSLFPDNDTCLAYLKEKYYPDGEPCPGCDRPTKFHRIASRASYSCQYCRKQVYPTAGTIFHKSTTSLHLWFWAIFLLSSTRCGISAKQLEREIGVSYPTAWRMFKQIRSLLGEDDPLSGDVEMDEMFVGGKPRQSDRARWAKTNNPRSAARKWSEETKTPVFGMVERGGKVGAYVVPSVLAPSLAKHIDARVLPATTIFTDEAPSYVGIARKRGYEHKRVHHKAHIYVDGTAHTNTIEGFWSLVKNGIRGVYHSVSSGYLQSYLDEYSFRYNRRDGQDPIFWAILDRAVASRLAGP